MLEKARESGQSINFHTDAFTADADNDGLEEMFVRRTDGVEPDIIWYDDRTFLEFSPPNDVWKPDHFKLAQAWFKIIDNKTVAFSLYRKDDKDVFLLDARLHQDGRTVILADYLVDLDVKVCLSAYGFDYDDTNRIQIAYKNLDCEKAFPGPFPGSMREQLDSFAREVQGGFCPVNFNDGDIPNELILAAEEMLFTHM